MLPALLAYYYDWFIQSWVSHYFHDDIILDEEHPHYRRLTEKYRKKQKVVKVFWLISGGLMIVFPILHAIVTLSLFTTFMSFAFLDEVRD